jgi:hypothetical protein
MSIIPATQEVEVGESKPKANQGKSLRLSGKQTKNKKKNWGATRVVEHLPCKCEVLNSIPSTTAMKKKKRQF